MTILQALADERKTLESEMQADTLEIRRLIGHRFDKWLALQKVEREMLTIARRSEP